MSLAKNDLPYIAWLSASLLGFIVCGIDGDLFTRWATFDDSAGLPSLIGFVGFALLAGLACLAWYNAARERAFDVLARRRSRLKELERTLDRRYVFQGAEAEWLATWRDPETRRADVQHLGRTPNGRYVIASVGGGECNADLIEVSLINPHEASEILDRYAPRFLARFFGAEPAS